MLLVENKKARLNYEISDTFEAGIELLGGEVKSLKEKRGKLEGAYGIIRGGEIFILGMHIPVYQVKNVLGEHEPTRTRRLLLTKKEIAELAFKEAKEGYTIVPLGIHLKNNRIKVTLGLGRGRKKYDKREVIKERETTRRIAREHRTR